jgi:hypothetical protein
MGRTCSTKGESGMHVGYWWERQRKELLGGPGHRWMGNIKTDRREIEWGGMDWFMIGASGGLL